MGAAMPGATRSALLLLLAAASLAGCADPAARRALLARASVEVVPTEPWRQAASEADAALVDGLTDTWRRLLAVSPPPRRGDVPLVDPQAGLARAAPGPGAYLCRFRPLGGPPPRRPADGFCYVGVKGERLSLTIEAGPERLGGYLFDDRTTARMVFLGAAAPRRSRSLPAYGEDRARDVAGVFERIGDFRYRLAVPSRDGSRIGLYELVPAPVP